MYWKLLFSPETSAAIHVSGKASRVYVRAHRAHTHGGQLVVVGFRSSSWLSLSGGE